MELTHHHKHIRNTSICGTILTEKTCAAKAVGKIHIESGRDGRKAIRLGPTPLEGDTKRRRIAQVQRCSLGSEHLSPRV